MNISQVHISIKYIRNKFNQFLPRTYTSYNHTTSFFLGHANSSGPYFDENDASGNLSNDEMILNTSSVNFNVCNLKEMLKCISCHRFLFPPILQCAQGHMSCKSCFEIKGNSTKFFVVLIISLLIKFRVFNQLKTIEAVFTRIFYI